MRDRIEQLAAAFGQVQPPAETAIALGGLGLAGAGALLLSAPAVARWVLPPPRETYLADHLPFESVLRDGKTVRCRDGRLVRVVEFLGIDTTPMTADERIEIKLRRKRWLEDLAEEGSCELKIVVTRRRTGVHAAGAFPDDVGLMEEVAAAWQGPLAETYRNRMFAVIGVRARLEQARARLDNIMRGIEATLGAFRPVELGVSKGGEGSPMHAFWADLLNPGDGSLPFDGQGPGMSDRLACSTLEFGGEAGLGTFRRGEEISLLAALGIRRWGDETSPDIVASLLALPAELTLLHLIEPQTQLSAMQRLQARKTASFSSLFGRSAEQDVALAMQWVDERGEGGQGLVRYQMTIFVHAAERDELDRGLQAVRRALAETGGMRAVREGASVAPLWFSLFPGNASFVRETDMLSQNVAELVPLESPVPGLEKSEFGDGPIAVFKSLGGAPYRFQFHISEQREETGHTLVIGPTGSGKTTFLCFLMGNAMRHANLRAYVFDSMLGAYVFTTGFGGRYLALQVDDDEAEEHLATLNPLRMSLNDVNRKFLRRWFELLTGCTDPEAKVDFARAVERLEKEPPQRRQLASIHPVAFEAGSEPYTRLIQWVAADQRGRVFNGVEDTLDLSGTRLVGFDMTRVFADDELVSALIPYLMHRIRGTVAEAHAPYILFFDETAHMLRNERMARFFEEELQQSRKRKGVTIAAFQEPDSLWRSGEARANIVLSACKTRVFFRNPAADYSSYERFGLTEFEWSFIKGHLQRAAHLRHAALVKRDTPSGPESVILDVGLDPLGRHLALFRSGSDAVDRAREAQKVWGPAWVRHYLAA